MNNFLYWLENEMDEIYKKTDSDDLLTNAFFIGQIIGLKHAYEEFKRRS